MCKDCVTYKKQRADLLGKVADAVVKHEDLNSLNQLNPDDIFDALFTEQGVGGFGVVIIQDGAKTTVKPALEKKSTN